MLLWEEDSSVNFKGERMEKLGWRGPSRRFGGNLRAGAEPVVRSSKKSASPTKFLKNNYNF